MTGIRIELQLEDGSFTSGILRAGQTLGQFRQELARTDHHFNKLSEGGTKQVITSFSRLEGETGSMLQRLRDISIIGGGVALAFRAMTGASNNTLGNFVRINAEMERLRVQMQGLSVAADPIKDAGDQVKYLQEVAVSAPFSLKEISNSFVKLKTAGIDPMNGSLQSLLDGIAAFGGSDESLHRITLGLVQLSGKGVVQMEEVRQQLSEAMPSAMKLMARSMGVSIAELTKAISTGRVESGAALEKWFKEVERTYGGTGEVMMKTFVGQLARVKSELVKLTTEGEMKSAFSDVKDVMSDIADGLDTQEARDFFDMVGIGIQKVVAGGRLLFDMLRSIKNWIEGFGPLMQNVFIGLLGGAALGAALKRIISGFNLMRVSALETKTAFQGMMVAIKGASIAQAGAAAATVAANAKSAAPSFVSLGYSAAVTPAATAASGAAGAGAAVAGVAASGSRLAALAGGAARLLGLLGPIAAGIGIILPLAIEAGSVIWSWFTGADKTKEAVDGLKSAALDAARDRFADEERNLLEALEDAKKQGDSLRASGKKTSFMRYNDGQTEYEAASQRALDAFYKRRSKVFSEAAEEDTRVEIEEAKKRVDATLQESRKAYRMREDQSYELYQKELELAKRLNTSQRQVTEEYHQRRRDSEAKQMRDTIAGYDKEIGSLRARINDATDEGVRTVLGGAMARLIADRAKLEEELKNINVKQYGIEFLNAPESDEKLFEKLQENAKTAAENVKALQAELNGASGEVAKLIYKIQRGDFGRLDEGSDQADQFRAALLAATIQAEALQEVMDATNALDSEIDRVRKNMQEREYRAKAILAGIDPNDEAAMLKWRFDNGMIEGVSRDIDKMMSDTVEKVTRGVNLSVASMNTLETTIKQEAFGSAAIEQINAVGQAILNVNTQVGALNGSLAGLNFGTAFQAGGISAFGPASTEAKTFLDYIALNEGTDFKPGSRGYNETLDYGRWTNGPVELTSMTLDQVLALQEKMRTPENRALYGDGAGSSAVGRYQIVSATLRDLIKEMGLNPTKTRFDEDTQDAMALHLAKNRVFEPGNRMQGTWASINTPEEEMRARMLWTGGVKTPAPIVQPGPTNDNSVGVVAAKNALLGMIESIRAPIAQRIKDAALSIDGMASREPDLKELEGSAALRVFLDELKASLGSIGNTDDENFGTAERQARERILNGDFGDKNVDAEQYVEILKITREIDEAQKRIKENKELARDIQSDEEKLSKTALEITQRQAEAQAKLADPFYIGMSSDLEKFNNEADAYLQKIEKLNGADSEAYKAALKTVDANRAALMSAEGLETLTKMRQTAEENRVATMTQRERAEYEMTQQIEELTRQRDAAIRSGVDEAQANETWAKSVEAVKRAAAADLSTPMQRSIEQMEKVAENLMSKAASWPSNLSQGLYESLTGTGDGLKGFAQQIQKDFAMSALDGISAGLMKPFDSMIEKMSTSLQDMVTSFMDSFVGKKGGGAGAGIAGGAVAATAGKMVATGDLSSATSRMITSLAPNSSEMPIASPKARSISPRDQGKMIGSTINNSRSISISAPISVHANGGTPEQNADLARQMASQSEGMLRRLVNDELIRQSRPGGMMRNA